MIYLKSLLAGFLALAASVAVAAVAGVIGITTYLQTLRPANRALALQTSVSLKSPFFWALILFIFGAGFLWEYRKLSR